MVAETHHSDFTPQRVERKKLKKVKATQVQLHDLCNLICNQCLPTALSGFTIQTSILWLLYILCKYMFENCTSFSFPLGVGAVGRNTQFRLKKPHLTTITKLKELRKFISWVAWRNEQMCERFEEKQSKKQFSRSQKTNFLYSLSSSVQIRQKYYYSFKCVLPTKHALNSKCKHYINNIGWQLNI